jgi:cytochrome P450
MASLKTNIVSRNENDPGLSLYNLLDPQVRANPYPLFHRLRAEDPVHWDPFIHAWVVTRYADVITVLHHFLAYKPAPPEVLKEMGLSALDPLAKVMMKQMLFMDPPAHTRLRGLAAKVFTPYRMEKLRLHIRDIISSLLDKVQSKGRMDVLADFAEPLPAIVTAELLGLPASDFKQLKLWSADFAERLGNFHQNPDGMQRVLQSLQDMRDYFEAAVREIKQHPREGLIDSFLTAEIDGDRLTMEEVVANSIITMVGGQETTTNLIGNGLLALLRNRDVLEDLRSDLSLIPSAVEELLRYEAPSQYTSRIAPEDVEIGGKTIRKGQATIVVMAAANHDPERFADPDRIDIRRKDNRHLAFGWATHFCFGAPLARIEGQEAFEAMLRRLPDLALEPGPLLWRRNLGLRGLEALPITFNIKDAGASRSVS